MQNSILNTTIGNKWVNLLKSFLMGLLSTFMNMQGVQDFVIFCGDRKAAIKEVVLPQ